MAIDILKTHVTHDVRHDLESFFWLLLWVVLRYTATTCLPPNDLYVSVFGAQTDRMSAYSKAGFLADEMDWEVKDNKPLTTLIKKYKLKCHKSVQTPPESQDEGEPLTYESVLALFDEALARPDWPQGDHALPFKMPSATVTSATQGGSQAGNSRGGEKRREAPGDEDPLSLPPHKRAHVYRRPVRKLPGSAEPAANDAPR